MADTLNPVANGPGAPQFAAPQQRTSGTNVRPYILGGFAVIASLVLGTVLWGARTSLAGAVIAPATVVVDSSVKKVQHQTGGIVGEIKVRNGDRVNAGDLLIHLDDTQTRANLQIITNQINEFSARIARLEAERDDSETISFPPDFANHTDDPGIKEIINGENVLFTNRRTSLTGQKKQLRERGEQFQDEIDGLTAQRAAKAKEIKLIEDEIESLSDLEERRLVTSAKMISLRREAARLNGEHAQLASAIAQAKGRIAEVEIAILQREQEFKTEVSRDMREAQTKLAELNERRIAAEDQLKRIDILSPATGYVHELAIHTVGGVVTPGEPIMLIVPDDDLMTLEARVAPRDREQVIAGAEATIRFAAFNTRTTPIINGKVSVIAADLTEDRRTGLSYYLVRISIPEVELRKLPDVKLVPGLPADVQIRTEDRTALSYLLKPIEDQFAKAFRER